MTHKLLVLTFVLLGACNADHALGELDSKLDAGGDPDMASSVSPDTKPPSSDASTSLADAPKSPPTTDPQTGTAESWTGYIENFEFASGSDRITLSLATSASGQVTGTVTFGNGIAPPAATDPNVGYPPGMNTVSTMPAQYLEGATYTIMSGTLQSNRLRLTIDPVELWTTWCALQTAPTDGSDLCVPNWGGTSDPTHTSCQMTSPSGESISINCVKWDLCLMSRICKCSSSGCTVNYEESGYKTSFDVLLSNGAANGSMKSSVLGDHNVHITKD